MLIVTGIGRCGSSAFMGFLKNVGLNLGSCTEFDEKIGAGYEHPLVIEINRYLINHVQAGEPLDSIVSRAWLIRKFNNLKTLNLDAVKALRCIWDTRVLDVWRVMLGHIYIIMLIRRPIEICESRGRVKDEVGDPFLTTESRCRYRQEVGSLHLFYRYKDFIILSYPEYIGQFGTVYQTLGKRWGILDKSKPKYYKEIWDKSLDKSRLILNTKV